MKSKKESHLLDGREHRIIAFDGMNKVVVCLCGKIVERKKTIEVGQTFQLL